MVVEGVGVERWLGWVHEYEYMVMIISGNI